MAEKQPIPQSTQERGIITAQELHLSRTTLKRRRFLALTGATIGLGAASLVDPAEASNASLSSAMIQQRGKSSDAIPALILAAIILGTAAPIVGGAIGQALSRARYNKQLPCGCQLLDGHRPDCYIRRNSGDGE